MAEYSPYAMGTPPGSSPGMARMASNATFTPPNSSPALRPPMSGSMSQGAFAAPPGSMGRGIPNSFGAAPSSPAGFAATMGVPGGSQDLTGMLPPSSVPPLPFDQLRGGSGPLMPPTSGPPMTSGCQPFTTMPSMPGQMAWSPPLSGPFETNVQSMHPHPTSVPEGLSPEFTIRILRLLDMPVAQTLLGNDKSYKVVVRDARNYKVGETGPIQGIEGQTVFDAESETLTLTPEEGTLNLKTHSALIYLSVEHVGGMLPNAASIGKCKIHRQDPRSGQVWPYMLSQMIGNEEVSANCGIELKVIEGSFHDGLGLHGMQSMVAGMQPGTSFSVNTGKLPSGRPPAFTDPIGLTAFLTIDKVTDLPFPKNHKMKKVLITVNSEENDNRNEYMRLMLNFKQMPGEKPLLMADCQNSKINVQAPVHFGGNDGEGAMYVRIGIFYVMDINHWDDTADVERVGMTDPIKVTWRPAPRMYQEVKDFEKHVLGGVHLSHRLMTEQEASNERRARRGAHARRPLPTAPKEPPHRVSGRTGHFPPGSPEEAYEQAILNCEAQNRALLQRCNKADPDSHNKNPRVQIINGYREWDSLDSLFTTMGPNPLAMSDEVGPSVTRGYHESEFLMKELAKDLIPPLSPADAQMNLELVKMYHKGDPFKVDSVLRPLICKDPKSIEATKDMSWCPDPPLYAPLRNMSEEDRETLRLACYDPSQNAKLLFQDVNPNYRINEDIWGVLADRKTARSLYVPRQEHRKKRVKDECLMA